MLYMCLFIVIYLSDTVTTLTSGLFNPNAIAFTPSGSLTYVLTDYQLLTMAMGGGSTMVLAGSGVFGFADGQGIAAMFSMATGLAVHPVTGVIYITDYNNNRIRACTPSGLVSTLVGSGVDGNVDGTSSTATFSSPVGILMDPTSSYLYVTCYFGHTIRQVNVLSGYTITVAGSGIALSNDGIGLNASFTGPRYVGDSFSGSIQDIDVGYISICDVLYDTGDSPGPSPVI